MSDRRPLNWNQIRGVRARLALITATYFGAGLLPWAPGTWGTIAAMPLVIAIAPWDATPKILIWSALFIAGTWASRIMDELMNSADNQNIVIDEVVGIGISAWFAGQNYKLLALSFILFRFFDTVKPFPIRQLDQWSKIQAAKKSGSSSAWWGGFGVMADDGLAGFQTLILVYLAQKFFVIT